MNFEQIPDINVNEEEVETPESVVPDKKPVSGLSRTLKKVLAAGSLIGLGALSQPAMADDAGTNDSNHRIESNKGHSLGAFYQKKFARNDEKFETNKADIAEAKNQLKSLGLNVEKDSDLTLEYVEGVPVKIIFDGTVYSFKKSQENQKVAPEQKVESTNNLPKKTGNLGTKTTLSDDAAEFLGK